jgi:predicted enzyme related to lactoylglutathione lyase
MAGNIGWIDLTVPNAESIRDFYHSVSGRNHSPVEMGGYQDFCMRPTDASETVAGICHARCENASMPPQWMIYINVDDLDESIRQCEQLGGKVRVPIRSLGASGRCCVIEDPAGAVAALFEPTRLEAA